MLWVASKALGISPFSTEFEDLSEAQITWAVMNHYKDQEEDLEKYKLICRFTNPEAASKLFDAPKASLEDEISEEFLNEIQKHSKHKLSKANLRQSLLNPESLPETGSIDTIERI